MHVHFSPLHRNPKPKHHEASVEDERLLMVRLEAAQRRNPLVAGSGDRMQPRLRRRAPRR
jgi:hypothetical protein